VHITYSVPLLQHVPAFFYGDHQVVLQTYKTGTRFSGRCLPLTGNGYRISITSLLRIFQNCGLIIVIKYGLEIIKSACAATIPFYACKCHLLFETPCVVDRGGSAFKYVDAQWKWFTWPIFMDMTLCMLCYSKLLRILVMCNVVTTLVNLSKYFAYKLSYAVLYSLYCQRKDYEFFLNLFLRIGNRFS
jgi:hypothetical protein